MRFNAYIEEAFEKNLQRRRRRKIKKISVLKESYDKENCHKNTGN